MHLYIRAYPTIEAVRLQRQVADGDLLTSWGEFDTKILADTMNEPTGFYENYRHGIGLAAIHGGEAILQQVIVLGVVISSHGTKERETLDGGEFKLAYIQRCCKVAISIHGAWPSSKIESPSKPSSLNYKLRSYRLL